MRMCVCVHARERAHVRYVYIRIVNSCVYMRMYARIYVCMRVRCVFTVLVLVGM